MKNQKIVIIGGGQAACQTAASLKNLGHIGEISIFSSENYLPYQRPPLSKKFLLGELETKRLFLKPEKFYHENDIKLNLNTYVEQIDKKNNTDEITNDNEYDKFDLFSPNASTIKPVNIGTQIS